MRPIRLTMSAFGSYAEEETIDFSGMEQGIFLITGDTGAGKTTIFDGIVYALFDRTSGGIRDGNMMRSAYASLRTPTFVELCFVCRGETYRIFRNPDYERESLRKDKNGNTKKTQEKSKAELYLPDGTMFRGNKKEINKKIEEILGMDARQFMQMAMIAQGDFLRLLLAKSEERKEIFSHLFDTRIYGYIQEELRKQEKEIFGRLKEKENALREQIGGILLPPNCSSEEKIKEIKETADAESARELLERLIENDQEQEHALQIQQEALEKEILENQNMQQLTGEMLEIKERICKQEQWLLEHKSKEEELIQTGKILEQTIEERENEKVQLEKIQETEKRIYQEQQNSFIKRIEELQYLWVLSEKYSENWRNQKKKAEDWEKANQSYSESREAYEQLYEAFFREQAGILAKTLKDGEPCPVCGSRKHPVPAEASSYAPDQRVVKNAREQVKKLEQIREEAGECYQKAAKEASAALAGLNQEGVRLLGEDFDGLEKYWCERIQRELDNIKAEVGKITNRFEAEEKTRESQRTAFVELIEGSKEKLKKNKTELEEFIRKSERIRGQNQSDKMRLRKLEEQWRDSGKEQLSDNEIEKISREYEKRKESLKEQKKELDQNRREYFSRLQGNRRILKILKQYQNEYENGKEEYAIIRDLSQTAGGTLSGNKKIDFESYVQRRYFQKVVQRANIRLMQMTSGQFLLKCQDFDRLSGRGKTGLDLDIYSLATESARDVKTLSGGESFMAALSLALGLADVVSESAGAVRLDTLFIDEGFGYLDDHAREQAVRVLYELSGQNRLIGIISHVGELKEQIEKKLYVRKEKNGSHVSWLL